MFTLFHHAFCPHSRFVRLILGEYGFDVRLVEDERIREVSAKKVKAPKNARVIDVRGRTLMPGLIDAHMHAYASDVNMFKVEALGTP